ncbi:MAG: type I-B CRISPR-associated protein Cas7/Cst2/DevR [Chthonomonadales bacterium]
MSNPVLTSAMLIEATGAALNNAGADEGQRTDNAVVVKKIRVGRAEFPYVSGQAVRRWWREVLYEDFGWQPSPVTREAKSAYTSGEPVNYPDDDMFGYMAAKKVKGQARSQKKDSATTDAATGDETSEGSKEKGDTGTQRRISPLKNSLLVSVLPNAVTSDFGHFSRDLPVDNPNMVPFEHEHYTTFLQGVFTISLRDVGRFECGLMRDLPLDAPVPEGGRVLHEAQGNLQPRVLSLSPAERRKRVADTILALGRLRHGANLTRNLSDVVPVVLLMGFLDGGNAPFQRLFTSHDTSHVELDLERLRSVVGDYKDRILGDHTLYFGYRPGVLANEAQVKEALSSGIDGVSFVVESPGGVIRIVAEHINAGRVELD